MGHNTGRSPLGITMELLLLLSLVSITVTKMKVLPFSSWAVIIIVTIKLNVP